MTKEPWLKTPERDNSTFSGWYLSDGTLFATGTILTGDTTVYAKWSCDDGYTEVNDACVDNTAPVCTWSEPTVTPLKS